MTIYKLSDIFTLQMGKTPARKNMKYWENGNNKWISISDLSSYDKYVSDTKEKITDQAIKETGIKIIPANTVIMSFKLSIGKTAITQEPVYSNEAIMAFIDKGVVPMIPDYIYYLFKYKKWDEETNKAVMGKTLNKATLANVQIDINSMEEQQRIVSILDRTNKILSNQKAKLKKLDILIKARFVEIFGDPKENPNNFMVSKLKDVSLKKLSYGSGASSTQYNGTVRYIRITDIKEDGSLNNEIKSPETIEDKYYLNDGDILFARTGATVGKTYRYRKTDGKAIYAGYLIRMIPNIDKVLPDYVFYFTKTDYYKYFIENTKRTVAQPNINSKEYGDLLICVPPLELQRQFVNFVNQVDKSKFFIFRIQACYNIFIQIDFNSQIF